MIGATITPTGTPALASVSKAASRPDGCVARGSIFRASSPSNVVIERKTDEAR